MKDSEYRIVDANLNRVREALRVIEELLRFSFNDLEKSSILKDMRHRFSGQHAYINDYKKLLLQNRNTENDVLKTSRSATEVSRKNLKEIFASNIGRALEALRVIEEYAKLFSPELSRAAKESRFELYAFEKEVYPLFSN